MKKDERKEELILASGDALRVQKDQLFRAEEQMGQMRQSLDALSCQGDAQDRALAELIALMDAEEAGGDTSKLYETMTPFMPSEVTADIQRTKVIPLTSEDSWEDYLGSVEWYARLEHLDLSTDPYMSLLSKREQDDFAKQIQEDYYEKKAQCDAMDYALAAFCGTVAGLVDIFLVGTPEKSMLGQWTDKQVDHFVEKISQKLWDQDEATRAAIKKMAKEKKLPLDKKYLLLKKHGIPYNQNVNKRPVGLQQSIQYLEKKFGVNYDASNWTLLNVSNASDLDKAAIQSLTAKNHHLLSLAHHPDIIGLIFSIIDQFTGETTFIAGGRFIRLASVSKKNAIDEFELRGSNLISKIVCGFVNWIGHCLSDVAGSNTTRADSNKRGMGLPIPGASLFQFLSLTPFKIGKDVAELVNDVFEQGYDMRFGLALSIPVVVNEILVRLCFALKRYFYHHLPLAECIPTNMKIGGMGIRQPELRRMMFVAHGTMCVWDAGDAVVAYVASNGNVLSAALHLNYFAYIRLAQAGLSELRAMYRQTHIDLNKMAKDTQDEWAALYQDAQHWQPAALS